MDDRPQRLLSQIAIVTLLVHMRPPDQQTLTNLQSCPEKSRRRRDLGRGQDLDTLRRLAFPLHLQYPGFLSRLWEMDTSSTTVTTLPRVFVRNQRNHEGVQERIARQWQKGKKSEGEPHRESLLRSGALLHQYPLRAKFRLNGL